MVWFQPLTRTYATTTTSLTAAAKNNNNNNSLTSSTPVGDMSTSNRNSTTISMGNLDGKSYNSHSHLHPTPRHGKLSCLLTIIFTSIFLCFLVPAPFNLSSFRSSLLSPPQSQQPADNPVSAVQPVGQSNSYSQSLAHNVDSSSANSTPPVAVNPSYDNPLKKTEQQLPETDETESETESKLEPVVQNDNIDDQPKQDEASTEELDGTAPSTADNRQPETSEKIKQLSMGKYPPPGMRQCNHVILFSAPRHGSTWFLDCVENCTFTNANEGTFGELNYRTELWIAAQGGPVANMSTDDAIDYIQRNLSLKVFPSPFNSHPDDIARIVESSTQTNTPIVVLTRSHIAAFRSYKAAIESAVWNLNSATRNYDYNEDDHLAVTARLAVNGKGSVKQSANDSHVPSQDMSPLEEYRLFLYWHFFKTYQLLDQRSLSYDVLDYDDVKKQKWIILPKNECYIYNCNFNQ